MLRERVLAAWAASPARFREDANAEEDLALGAYRDRLVVELAQNAADAAARAHVPGRLLLRLDGDVLTAANTGAPLDAAGVEALATLRASAKRDRDGSVGRFGVGFAAVLAVSDEPSVRSCGGGVRFSRARATELASAVPALAGELAQRGGHVPALRLPFAEPAAPPAGFDTAVVLPLRDAAAAALARRLLAEVDPALLLALPALAEVVLEVDGVRRDLAARREPGTVVVSDGGVATRWAVAAREGPVDPALLADRPTEERRRDRWAVTWGVPVDDGGAPTPLPPTVPRVVHAPTPTDDPLSPPALLVATLPLDPGRRRVAPGALRDAVLREAAATYTDLLRRLDGPGLLDLVPVGLPAGEVDAALRPLLLAALSQAPLLPAATDGATLLRPRDAAVVTQGIRGAADPAVLATVLPDIVAPAWWRRADALRALGVREIALADVVDALASVRLGPDGWRRLYAALDGADRDALGALPVPLADGRLVRGPRGLLLPAGEAGPEHWQDLVAVGLRVVHPDAVHPLLERLGALPATPRAVLADPTLRALVAGGADPDDPGSADAVTAAVLGLVALSGATVDDEPWLADLVLRDDEGEPAPPGELHLPGSPLAQVTEPDDPPYPVDPLLLQRWGPDVLRAVGVLDTFAVARDRDVVLDGSADHDLDGEAAWVAAVLAAVPPQGAPPVLDELVAVRDLDAVRRDAWPRALALLAEPPLRDAVLAPAHVALADGRRVAVPPYTAWWLRTHPVLGGRRASELRLPGSDPRLAGLYDELSGELAAAVPPLLAPALGVRASLDALLAEPGGAAELLDRLADPARAVGRGQLGAIYRALAAADPEGVAEPQRVRAVAGGEVVVVAAEAVVVLDAPDLMPLLGGRPVVVIPPSLADPLADLLGLPLATEVARGAVASEGTRQPVPPLVARVLAGAPATWVEHDDLIVDGRSVEWRVADGVVHAATPDGLARGLAWAAGRWSARHLVAEVLAAPDRVDDLVMECELDE